MRKAIFTLLLSLTIPLGLGLMSGSEAKAAAYPPEVSYCGERFAVWSFLCTATSTYSKGQPITFTLYLFQPDPIATSSFKVPWKIVDEQGNTVYLPLTPSIVQASVGTLSAEWSYTWDQTDNKGKKVHKGAYSMVFPPLPVPFFVMPLTVNVTNKIKDK